MSTATVNQNRVNFRVPASLIDDAHRRAIDEDRTTTSVILDALETHFMLASTPAGMQAGRLVAAEAAILGDDASTTCAIRILPGVRAELTARAAHDHVSITAVLIAALTAYVVGDPAAVKARFDARFAVGEVA